MFRLTAAAMFLAMLSGCGYRFADGGALAASGASIEIRMFENASTEPGLEKLMAEAFSEEFARRGWLEPQFAGESDLTLRGNIREVRTTPSAVSSVAIALEETVEVTFDVAVRRADGEVVYRHSDFTARELYRASPDPNTHETRKEQALRRLSAEVAERIHDELFQKF